MDVGEADDGCLAMVGRMDGAVKRAPKESMNLRTGYGRFAAAVNSLLIAILWLGLCLSGGTCTNRAYKARHPGRQPGGGLRRQPGPGDAGPARGGAQEGQGRNVTVINHGVSGDTTAGGLERIDWMLADKPDIVIVELGGNDALRGTDPATTERNLDAIITKLKAAGVTVWLAGMLAPRNFGPEYAQQFDGLYKRLADKHGVPLYPFFLDGVAPGSGAQPARRHPSQPQGRRRDRRAHRCLS